MALFLSPLAYFDRTARRQMRRAAADAQRLRRDIREAMGYRKK